ncbi:MAG: esterase/lipase family protein [Coprococcus sp.]
MKIVKRFINAVIVFLMSNIYLISKFDNMVMQRLCVTIFATLYILIMIMPLLGLKNIQTNGIRRCQAGCELLYAFLVSTAGSIVLLFLIIFDVVNIDISGFFDWLGYILLAVLFEAICFWVGIIRVYVSSKQIAVKWRVIGIICGWIPIVHLIVLGKILMIASRENKFENDKIIYNASRCNAGICATRYPILMVHGVFFRDFRYLNYWGRIPAELEKNGARIFYGNQQSAASVEECGRELAARIIQVLKETGSEKVNIIAHSKGGLDSRYAISMLGMDKYVASLTTINTPHRGCAFADYLLSVIPQSVQERVAKMYNAALRKFGDYKPDFMAAVRDLTFEACRRRNEMMPDTHGVPVISTGSCLTKPSGGRFPLNMTNGFVRWFDGANDGLVGSDSFKWGDEYIYLTPPGKRGISHGDIIDLNRENIEGFDVREFYVQLVYNLKKRGF